MIVLTLIGLWLCASALVGSLFILLVMACRQDDEMRTLARQPDRYLTLINGGVELRPRPFDFEKSETGGAA